jgi:hypothetical protein
MISAGRVQKQESSLVVPFESVSSSCGMWACQWQAWCHCCCHCHPFCFMHKTQLGLSVNPGLRDAGVSEGANQQHCVTFRQAPSKIVLAWHVLCAACLAACSMPLTQSFWSSNPCSGVMEAQPRTLRRSPLVRSHSS